MTTSKTGLTASAALVALRARLANASETPLLDAQALLAHILNTDRSWLLAHPAATLTDEQQSELEEKSARLAQGEPLAYLTGRREFYGLEFDIIPGVLVPRPETELLVEQALGWLAQHPERRAAADVGCGSGIIAVTLAVKVPDLRVIAVDIDEKALALTHRNAEKHGVAGRVIGVHSNLLGGLDMAHDLICANLPYIPTAALAGLDIARHEPALALDGGPDGLDLIRRLVEQIPSFLNPGGLALLEIEAGQGASARALALQKLPGTKIDVLKDLAGHDRLLRIG
jgi:release factor glutamine methyltransferase